MMGVPWNQKQEIKKKAKKRLGESMKGQENINRNSNERYTSLDYPPAPLQSQLGQMPIYNPFIQHVQNIQGYGYNLTPIYPALPNNQNQNGYNLVDKPIAFQATPVNYPKFNFGEKKNQNYPEEEDISESKFPVDVTQSPPSESQRSNPNTESSVIGKGCEETITVKFLKKWEWPDITHPLKYKKPNQSYISHPVVNLGKRNPDIKTNISISDDEIEDIAETEFPSRQFKRKYKASVSPAECCKNKKDVRNERGYESFRKKIKGVNSTLEVSNIQTEKNQDTKHNVSKCISTKTGIILDSKRPEDTFSDKVSFSNSKIFNEENPFFKNSNQQVNRASTPYPNLFSNYNSHSTDQNAQKYNTKKCMRIVEPTNCFKVPGQIPNSNKSFFGKKNKVELIQESKKEQDSAQPISDNHEKEKPKS